MGVHYGGAPVRGPACHMRAGQTMLVRAPSRPSSYSRVVLDSAPPLQVAVLRAPWLMGPHVQFKALQQSAVRSQAVSLSAGHGVQLRRRLSGNRHRGCVVAVPAVSARLSSAYWQFRCHCSSSLRRAWVSTRTAEELIRGPPLLCRSRRVNAQAHLCCWCLVGS